MAGEREGGRAKMGVRNNRIPPKLRPFLRLMSGRQVIIAWKGGIHRIVTHVRPKGGDDQTEKSATFVEAKQQQLPRSQKN